MEDPKKTQTPADDWINQGPTLEDIVLPTEIGRMNQEAQIQGAAQARQNEADYDRLMSGSIFKRDGLMGTAFRTTLVGQVIAHFGGDPTPPVDPNFTAKTLEERIKEAQLTLPEGYTDALRDAHSDEHFEQIFRRQYALYEAERMLAEQGWTGMTAKMAAEVLDPLNLAISLATFQGGRAYGIARGSNIARFGGAAAGGAAGGVIYAGGQKAFGADISAEEMLFTAGAGALAGGVLDTIITNPATGREVAAISHVFRKGLQESQVALQRVRGRNVPTEPTQAAVKRAEEVVKSPEAVTQPTTPSTGPVTQDDLFYDKKHSGNPYYEGSVRRPDGTSVKIWSRDEVGGPYYLTDETGKRIEGPMFDTPKKAQEAARLLPPTTPEAPAPEPVVAPLVPTPDDRVKIVPSIQREGPDVTVSALQEYQRKFGTEALLKEAREQGFKKIPKDTPEDQIAVALVEAGKKQIVDRAMAAGGKNLPTWASVTDRVQEGVSVAAQRVAQGAAPEEAIQDALMAAGRQEIVEEAPAPIKQDSNVSLVEQLRNSQPDKPVPEEFVQEFMDAVDAVPAREPGRARILPRPGNLKGKMADNHLLEVEGADGNTYRLSRYEDPESGLTYYQVFNVSGRRLLAKEIDTFDAAKAMVPGLVEESRVPKSATKSSGSKADAIKAYRETYGSDPPPKMTAKQIFERIAFDKGRIARQDAELDRLLGDEEKLIEIAQRRTKAAASAERALRSGGMSLGDVRKAGGGKYLISLADESRAYSDRHYDIYAAPERGNKPQGEPLGFVALKQHRDGRWEVDMVEVRPEHQGKGLSKLLYETVERDLGITMQPSGVLLPDGYHMWLKRDADAVKWHRKFVQPHNGKEEYLSPRRMLQDLFLAKEQFEEYVKRGPKFAKQAEQRKNAIDQLEANLNSLPPEAKTPEAMQQMFRLRDELPQPGELRAEARADVERILQRILPAKVKKEIAPDVYTRDGENVLGSYDPIARVVKVALKSTNPSNTAWHEAVHALRDLRVFTRAEWSQLTSYARNRGVYERLRIEERYRAFYEGQGAGELQVRELMDEEAVAHVIAEYATGAMRGGPIQGLVDRVLLLWRRIKQAINIRFTSEDEAFDTIVRRMRTGEMARRSLMIPDDPGALEMAALPIRPDIPPNRPDLRPEDWDDITPDQVPETRFANARWDLAALNQRSQNPANRLVMNTMLNDSVGKVDHAVNPFSVDQDMVKTFNQYTAKFSQAFNPAYQEWFDANNLPMYQWADRKRQFGAEITTYLRSQTRGEYTPGTFHPSVERAGDAIANIMAKEWLPDLKNPFWRIGRKDGRAIPGAEYIGEDKSYVWRKFDHDLVRSAIDEFGMGFDEAGNAVGVTLMVKNAIREAQPDIPEEYLDRLANGYVNNIYRRSVGMEDSFNEIFAEGTYDQVRRLLTDNSVGFTPEEADIMLARMQIEKPDGGSMTNLKRRVLLSENYVERNINGSGRDLAFSDLLENDIATLFFHQSRRIAGRVALGRMTIRHPDGSGRTLVDGIVDDRDWDELNRFIDSVGARFGYNAEQTTLERNRRQFIYDRIKGIPDSREFGPLAENMRLWREFNVTRLMGQVGIAQLGEFGEPLGALGMKAALQHLPDLRTFIDQAGNQRLANPLFDEVQALGIGVDRLHGWKSHKVSGLGDEPFTVYGHDSPMRIVQRMTNRASQATYGLSGQNYIQYVQEIWVGAMVAQKFADMAMKPVLSRSDLKRMAQLGLDEPMIQRILNQMTHASKEPGILFQNRLTALNLDQWTDLQARASFENAMFRMTRKLIQSQDIGSLALWMSNPMAKTWFQFRNFAFTAWANKTLYNLHMADFPALLSMLYSVAWAGTVRGMQVAALSAARSDGEKYREKELDPWALGKAGFSRSGWSSVMPMAFDTALYAAGQPGQFGNVRNSGQPSNAILGSPIMTAYDSVFKTTRSLTDSFWKDRDMTQPEIRTAVSLLPFSNLLPITMAVNTLISDRPEKAPRIPITEPR